MSQNLIYTTIGNVKKYHHPGCQEMLWKFFPIILHEMPRKCWNFMYTGNGQKYGICRFPNAWRQPSRDTTISNVYNSAFAIIKLPAYLHIIWKSLIWWNLNMGIKTNVYTVYLTKVLIVLARWDIDSRWDHVCPYNITWFYWWKCSCTCSRNLYQAIITIYDVFAGYIEPHPLIVIASAALYMHILWHFWDGLRYL